MTIASGNADSRAGIRAGRVCFVQTDDSTRNGANDVTAKNWTEDELVARERARREAQAEFERLKQQWPELRRTLRPEAIMVLWFLYGDGMFETHDVPIWNRVT